MTENFKNIDKEILEYCYLTVFSLRDWYHNFTIKELKEDNRFAEINENKILYNIDQLNEANYIKISSSPRKFSFRITLEGIIFIEKFYPKEQQIFIEITVDILDFLKKVGITEERIKERLKSLFKLNFKKDFDEMIELIYSKRNFLVHEAKDIITEADRDFIKEVSEHLIDFFLDITQKVQDIGMLEFLFDNMNKPEEILIKEINILKFIKNLKSP